MTCIVYRDGVMAADSGAWMGDTMVDVSVKKIHRTPDGTLVGTAGDSSDGTIFKAWADIGFTGDCPSVKDCSAIVVSPDGSIRTFDAGSVSGTPKDWCSVGCANGFVTGALLMGASASEAVGLAIDRCAFVGGHVNTACLIPPVR